MTWLPIVDLKQWELELRAKERQLEQQRLAEHKEKQRKREPEMEKPRGKRAHQG